MARPSWRRPRTVLDRIEKRLVAEDPGLASIFEIFTRLTWHEAMPGTEQARRGQWRVRPTRWLTRRRIIVAGLIAFLSVPVYLGLAFGPHGCGTVSAQRQSAVQTASCRPAPSRSSIPTTTGHPGLVH
jgi:hypothetical protein